MLVSTLAILGIAMAEKAPLYSKGGRLPVVQGLGYKIDNTVYPATNMPLGYALQLQGDLYAGY